MPALDTEPLPLWPDFRPFFLVHYDDPQGADLAADAAAGAEVLVHDDCSHSFITLHFFIGVRE